MPSTPTQRVDGGAAVPAKYPPITWSPGVIQAGIAGKPGDPQASVVAVPTEVPSMKNPPAGWGWRSAAEELAELHRVPDLAGGIIHHQRRVPHVHVSVHCAELPEASVAMQVTAVSPTGRATWRAADDGHVGIADVVGVQVNVTTRLPSSSCSTEMLPGRSVGALRPGR